MSIEQLDVIDFASINPEGKVVLTISDHLDWVSKNNHSWILQEKVNAYISFIESGQLLESYPDSKNRKVIVSVKGMFDASSEAIELFSIISDVLSKIDVEFRFEHTPLKDDAVRINK